jgi:hypothetical protein
MMWKSSLHSFCTTSDEDVEQTKDQRGRRHDGEDIKRNIARDLTERLQPDAVPHFVTLLGDLKQWKTPL